MDRIIRYKFYPKIIFELKLSLTLEKCNTEDKVTLMSSHYTLKNHISSHLIPYNIKKFQQEQQQSKKK